MQALGKTKDFSFRNLSFYSKADQKEKNSKAYPNLLSVAEICQQTSGILFFFLAGKIPSFAMACDGQDNVLNTIYSCPGERH